MRRWLLLLGGLLIWAIHFGLIYAISSISVLTIAETGMFARVLIVSSGGLAIMASLWVWRLAQRMKSEEPLDQFWRAVASAGAIFGAIAVAWQSMPAFAPI